MKLANALIVAMSITLAMTAISAGPAIASSTALCLKDEVTCAAANRATALHLVDPQMRFLSIIDVECEALFSGTVLGLSSPQVIHGNFTVSNCDHFCTITQIKGGLLNLLRTSANFGTVAGQGFEFKVVCFGLVNCVYDLLSIQGPAEGAESGSNGVFRAFEQTVSSLSGGPLCVNADLDTVLQSLTAFYVSA